MRAPYYELAHFFTLVELSRLKNILVTFETVLNICSPSIMKSFEGGFSDTNRTSDSELLVVSISDIAV